MKGRIITSENELKPKYPKTPHFTFSETISSDDKILKNLAHFEGKEIVILIKMDGECHTMTKEYQHARSLDSSHHPSQSWVKGYHGSILHMLDPNVRYCGEDVYAMHNIKYTNLDSYFLCFNTWDRKSNVCHSWDHTIELCHRIGMSTVPELYRGVFDMEIIEDIFKKMDKTKNEGIVVRLAREFHYDEFSTSLAKAVRKNHIEANNFEKELTSQHGFTEDRAKEEAEKHWSKRFLIKNELK